MSDATALTLKRDYSAGVTAGLAVLSFLLHAFLVIGVLGYWHLPLLCFVVGLFAYRYFPDRAMRAFFFLLPLLPAAADYRFAGFAFNLIALPFFCLAGMLLGAFWRKERLTMHFAGIRFYRLFLAILWISALFVFLRWSNLTLASRAFLRDTPVNPSQLAMSVAAFIPLSTLLLYTFAPTVVSLLRARGLTVRQVLNAVSSGYLLSLALAVAQSSVLAGFMTEDWWAIEKRFNGGFSDYNAFALFSGLLFLFHTLRLLNGARGRERLASLFFLPASLAGIGLSGTRSALLFLVVALGFFLFQRRIRLTIKIAGLALLVAGFLLFGGTLKARIGQMISSPDVLTGGGGTVRMLNFLTNNRLLMIFDSARMLARFPVSGIGVGNFYNYRDYLHFRGRYYSDLALNQYLQVLDETGVPGLLAFLGFWLVLLRHSRRGVPRTLLLVFSVTLLFSNYLWFPESVLFVFVLIYSSSLRKRKSRRPQNRGVVVAGSFCCWARLQSRTSSLLPPCIPGHGA